MKKECGDHNAEIDYSSSSDNSEEILPRCICNEGFISSATDGVKNVLGEGETCVPVLGSNNIETLHDSISVKLDSTIGVLTIDNFEVIRHGKCSPSHSAR